MLVFKWSGGPNIPQKAVGIKSLIRAFPCVLNFSILKLWKMVLFAKVCHQNFVKGCHFFKMKARPKSWQVVVGSPCQVILAKRVRTLNIVFMMEFSFTQSTLITTGAIIPSCITFTFCHLILGMYRKELTSRSSMF